MSQVYALNLFHIARKEEYLAYSRRSAKAMVGESNPRQVLILVEWSTAADLHPHRVNGSADYIWHLFDKLEDLRPLFQ
jgi:hypothetical protein